MRTASILTAALLAAGAAAADEDHGHGHGHGHGDEERREMGAHEHGVSTLDVAFEGASVLMVLEAPGADIVGFEHAAGSEEDVAAVREAKATLSKPLSLFVLPEGAGCTVASADVEIVADGEHGHDDEHAEEAGHDDDHGHGHDEEAAEGRHKEFHAEYALDCARPEAIDAIRFDYFEAFPNAREVEVRMVGSGGSAGFEVERDSPTLDIPGNI